MEYLLHSGKEYIALMHLHKEIPENSIKDMFEKYTGKIKQLPPIKSAVRRRLRERTIYYIELLEIDGKDVLFKVGCEAGTYIRKLCLHSDTEILSKNGLITAKDFYLNPQIIYSLNKNKMIEKKSSAVQKLHSPIKLIRINMSSGINIIVTPNHKLLKSSKEGYKMIEAQGLKEGDFLVKSLKFPINPKEYIISDLLDDEFLIAQLDIKKKCKEEFIKKYGSIRNMNRNLKLDRKAFLSKSNIAISIKHLKLAGIYENIKNKINTFKTEKGRIIKIDKLTSDFFYLLGLVASDGNNTKEKNTKRYTRIKFHNLNEGLINLFLRIYKNIFPNIHISKKKVQGNLFQLDTSNSLFATITASLGIKSPQKNSDLLPILNFNQDLIKAFLRGYFDGDGSAYYKKKIKIKGQYSNIRFHTTNYTYAKRLHEMLLKVNIPNKIFSKKIFYKQTLQSIKVNKKKGYNMYDVSIETPVAKKKFIREIGSNHPFKISKFKQILSIKDDSDIGDHYYIGIHFKEEIRKNKSKLHKMGGNLNRVLNTKIPITRGFYKKASKLAKIPLLDEFIIEKIKSIEEVKGVDYVYDMTVPETHNFLIETGFISSNCHDIGQSLGCGAHMQELRRTKAGTFNESTLFTLQDLSDAFWYYKNEGNEKFIRKIIQPVETALFMPKIWISDSAVEPLCHGTNLMMPGIIKFNSGINKNDTAAILTLKDELVCLGKALMSSEEINRAKKGIAVNVNKVFMLPGTYQLSE